MSGETSAYRPFRSDAARDRYLKHYDAADASWPVSSEFMEVPTPLGVTFVRATGPKDGKPLVLLPAGNSSSQGWYPLISALSDRFRTYAVDAIYDVGKSVPSRDVRGGADAVKWIDGLTDCLGLDEPFGIAGISIGASVAAEYELHAPDRVARACWISPAAVVGPVSPAFVWRALTCVLPLRSSYERYVRWMMPDLVTRTAEFNQLVDGLLLARDCYGMAPRVNPRELTDDELSSIAHPVLYVVGQHDVVAADVTAAISRVDSVMSSSRTVVLDGLGHEAYAMRPERVADEMVQFFSA